MIRQARPEDADQIARLLRYQRLGGKDLFWGLPETEQGLTDTLRQTAWPVLVSELRGQVAGFGFLRPVTDTGPMRFLALTGLALQPGTAEGEAEKLAGLLETAARQMHVVWLIAPLCADDRAALESCARRGYEPVGHLRQAGLENGVWKNAVWLGRQLARPERAILERWEPVPFSDTELAQGLEQR